MAKSNKPIVWGLFAAGGTISAFVAPVMILITGLLVPLGVFGEDAMSYERMTAFLSHWIVKIGLLGIVILTLWHAAHRLRITAHDFGIRNDSTIAMGVYGFAGLFSVIALFAVLAI
ncbi:fumarate reductase subunit FrdD [Roseospira navarrensis]|uniref:Fumarate reductase subunit D n=1 Tax=Roseospira navarrensis TaxID=140058 RepID=A0A7X2D1H3_9PROT|nr:fumarate reductase subunit FrdD [Roseospira navarrensis]MQX35139.1 fumarate reductase subunit D [Roseospira navarrensis]